VPLISVAGRHPEQFEPAALSDFEKDAPSNRVLSLTVARREAATASPAALVAPAAAETRAPGRIANNAIRVLGWPAEAWSPVFAGISRGTNSFSFIPSVGLAETGAVSSPAAT